MNNQLLTGGCSNTPLELQTQNDYDANWTNVGEGLKLHIDYLKCRAKIHPDKIKDFLDTVNLLREEWAVDKDTYMSENQWLIYNTRYHTPQGIKVWVGDVIIPKTGEVKEDKINVLFEMTGTVCSTRNIRHIVRLINCMDANYLPRWLRIDFAIDDYNKTLCMDAITDALEMDNYKNFENYDARKSKKNKQKGRTIYLGSRGSDKFVRIYQTLPIHPEIDTIRYEMQMGGDLARTTIGALKRDYPIMNTELDDAVEKYEQAITNYCVAIARKITSMVAFIDRKANSNVTRCPLLKWWSDWCNRIQDGVASMQIKRTYPKPDLWRTMEWHSRQVAKSLLVVRETFGSTFFWQYLLGMMEQAKDRLNSFDRARVHDYKRYKSVYNIA